MPNSEFAPNSKSYFNQDKKTDIESQDLVVKKEKEGWNEFLSENIDESPTVSGGAFYGNKLNKTSDKESSEEQQKIDTHGELIKTPELLVEGARSINDLKEVIKKINSFTWVTGNTYPTKKVIKQIEYIQEKLHNFKKIGSISKSKVSVSIPEEYGIRDKVIELFDNILAPKNNELKKENKKAKENIFFSNVVDKKIRGSLDKNNSVINDTDKVSVDHDRLELLALKQKLEKNIGIIYGGVSDEVLKYHLSLINHDHKPSGSAGGVLVEKVEKTNGSVLKIDSKESQRESVDKIQIEDKEGIIQKNTQDLNKYFKDLKIADLESSLKKLESRMWISKNSLLTLSKEHRFLFEKRKKLIEDEGVWGLIKSIFGYSAERDSLNTKLQSLEIQFGDEGRVKKEIEKEIHDTMSRIEKEKNITGNLAIASENLQE
ncbi:MAG: hypothetical protein WCO84_00145 [bacterium]